MNDLIEFLWACIEEDERAFDLPDYDVVLNSHGQVSARGDGWVTRGDCPICGAYMFDGTESVTEEAWWDHAEKVHQRARRLADCKAKREMVEDLRDELANQHDPEPTTLQLAERMLRALALPYADRPDYREEWKV